MNDALKNLMERRSCRSFKPDMISREELDAVLAAGTYAPTGMGRQSPIIIAVTDKTVRDEIMAENRRIGGWDESVDPFYGAPVILIVCAAAASPHAVYDGSLVMGNLMNAANALGLGSCWIHRARQEFESDFGRGILAKLGIGEEYIGIGHVALGYPEGPCRAAAPRKENYVYYID